MSKALRVLPSAAFPFVAEVIEPDCGHPRSVRPTGMVKEGDSFICGFCESEDSGQKMAPAHRVEPLNILNNGQE